MSETKTEEKIEVAGAIGVDPATPDPAPAETSNDDERSLIERFVNAQKAVDDAAAVLKRANQELDAIDKKLLALLEDDGKKASAKYEDLGYVVIVEGAAHASIEKGRAEDVMNHLKEIGRDDMIKTSVAPATLSVYVRECLKENKPLPDGVTFYKPKYLKPYLAK